MPISATDIEVDSTSSTSSSDGDHDVFSHYVEKDEVADAIINGWPVVALCGKIWIPFRDPERYPVCPKCDEEYKKMQAAS